MYAYSTCTRNRAWCVSTCDLVRWHVLVHETEVVNADVPGGMWQCMVAYLVLKFFGFCRSRAIEDHGIVGFLKLWADLHRFEGLGHGLFERSWLRVGARATIFGLENY